MMDPREVHQNTLRQQMNDISNYRQIQLNSHVENHLENSFEARIESSSKQTQAMK